MAIEIFDLAIGNGDFSVRYVMLCKRLPKGYIFGSFPHMQMCSELSSISQVVALAVLFWHASRSGRPDLSRGRAKSRVGAEDRKRKLGLGQKDSCCMADECWCPVSTRFCCEVWRALKTYRLQTTWKLVRVVCIVWSHSKELSVLEVGWRDVKKPGTTFHKCQMSGPQREVAQHHQVYWHMTILSLPKNNSMNHRSIESSPAICFGIWRSQDR